jgi:hypothetical protein
MSKSARSILLFSIYMFGLGSIMVLSPNFLLKLFFVPETNEVWIRVAGVLVLILGFYYFLASRNDIKLFFKWTVYARSSVVIFFIGFVIFGLAPPVLILFGIVDAAAAYWTNTCLKAEQNKQFINN